MVLEPDAIEPPKARTVGIGAGPTPLFVEPVAMDPLEISYPGPFQVRQRRPDWVLIEARWADGSRLRGWTFERNTKADAAPISGRGGGGKHRAGCVSIRRPVLSRMTVRRGAAIAASPGGVVWAHTTKTMSVGVVQNANGQGAWVLVECLPGLRVPSCSEGHIWTQLRDIVGGDSAATDPRP